MTITVIQSARGSSTQRYPDPQPAIICVDGVEFKSATPSNAGEAASINITIDDLIDLSRKDARF